MIATEGQEHRAERKSQLSDQFRNPGRLRLCLTIAVLGIGYAAVYLPLDSSITAATSKRADSEKRLSLANDVEQLRKQFRLVEKRLPKQADMDEWAQYVLAAIRRSPLKMQSFSPGVMKPLGPYQMVYLSYRLSGSLADLDGFLHWLESNERLFRVESVNIVPESLDNGDEIDMDIAVLGVMG
jgi:Tfp pilus assembly protein PilO